MSDLRNGMPDIINQEIILGALKSTETLDRHRIRGILAKARALTGLDLPETAYLLQSRDPAVKDELFEAAQFIKEAVYGKRLVLFAPMYISNSCLNNCLYCGFRRDNQELQRKCLDPDSIRNEVRELVRKGHKRLLLVAAEDPGSVTIEFLENAIRTVYATTEGAGAIRRINVNVAPMSVAHFKRLKNTGIGTYQLFQETYHSATYRQMHPSGPKADYQWRLEAMDRAQEAGIDDVGIGALFGLYDHRFEVLSMLCHAQHLERQFGTGPHTISVPRIRPAKGAPLTSDIPFPLSDDDFKRIVAILRCAIPYTGIILSTREAPSLRDEVIALGISQISAGSRTSPGDYAQKPEESNSTGQFQLEDKRTQLEVVKDIARRGYLPSFCTSCYRAGRTGKNFMNLAKPGAIKEFCGPNCLLTFKEYVLDYGDEILRLDADRIIRSELQNIQNTALRGETVRRIQLLEQGERDLYF